MSQPLPPAPEAPRDEVVHRVEVIIARLLRWGVLTSLVLMLAGTLISFLRSGRYGHTSDDVQRMISESGNFPHNIRWLVEGLATFRGQQLIVLGLLLLILTPVLRVAVSIVAYLIERDFAFVLITSTVLALLILSFFVGGHG
jgi:uncharacterized membrane protein